MSAKIKVTVKTPKKVPYKVGGANLAEVWKDIEKKGPKDGGKPRAGYTRAPAKLSKIAYPAVCTEDSTSGEWTCEVTASVLEFKIEPVTIKHPKLTTEKKLSDKAKKHWKSFMKELLEHEQEHVDTTKDETQSVAEEVAELSVTESNADKKKAEKAAIKAYEKAFKSQFGGSFLNDRLDAANKALDSSGHGPVLDTSIP